MKKKNIILSLIFILLLLFLINMLFVFLKFYRNKLNFENNILEISEKNNNSIFIIDNITLFSSCNADTDIKSNSDFTLKNLYQYTDIAIFINNTSSSKELSAENTLKEVNITNIKFAKSPDIGQPQLYYKNINNFAKPILNKEDKLETDLKFQITSEDNIDYSNPTLYNNCANPITLSFVNNNIKSNYALNISKPITYDGSLLKSCNIVLNSISCNICFDIFITNNLNQKFICPISIDIPLERDSKSIYDGNLSTKNTEKHIFYRYE